MEQQSAFSMYNKRILKSKPTQPFKLKKTHKKKKHLIGNEKNKELNGYTNQKKLKKQKKRKLQLQSNESNSNTKKISIITPELKPKQIEKVVKNKERKSVKFNITDDSLQDLDSDNESPPTLIKIFDNLKQKNETKIEKLSVMKPKLIAHDKKKITSQRHEKKEENNDENSFETAKRLLHWIIQPVSVANFFDNSWEKTPLHIKRNQNKYFNELFSSEALDTMLRHNVLFFKTNVDIAIYKDGVRQDADTAGRAYPSLVWDHYYDGYTVRISDPQTYDSKLRSLLSTLQEFFGCFVGSNVYLTPPGSQGFAPHYDDIEAFIIQIEGRKHWKLYNPPTDEDVLARESSGNYPRSTVVQPPLKEITLNAGDVLYFPRGIVHEGYTDADSHSLHLTVSTYQKTAYADLLEMLCKQAMEKAFKSSVDYRKGLPLHYLRHAGVVNTGKRTDTRKELMTNVRKLFQGLWEHVDIDSAVDEMGRKFMIESLPPQYMPQEIERTCMLDGDHLLNGRVIDRAEFNPDTKVRLLRYHCIRLVVDKVTKEAKIYYNITNKGYKEVDEQFLVIELSQAPIVESLLESYPHYTSIEAIPHEDLLAKTSLVQVLWQYGLIVTESKIDIFAFEEDDDDDTEMTTEMINSNDEESESDSDSDEVVTNEVPKKMKKKN